MTDFGKSIALGRKSKFLSQKELAARIRKQDGEPISTQYLNDIERGRRNPPDEHIRSTCRRAGFGSGPFVLHSRHCTKRPAKPCFAGRNKESPRGLPTISTNTPAKEVAHAGLGA